MNDNKNNMTHSKLKPALVLTVIAIIWTALIMVLELSDVGQSWDRIGENLNRITLNNTLIFLKLILAGCLIGLVPFTKSRYKTRIALSIPSVFMVFCLYQSIIMIDFHYGLTDDFNYFTAKKDIEKGKIQVLHAGQLYYESDEVYRALDSLSRSYGYTLINAGVFSPGAERYNKVMKDYLKRKNGPGWEDEYRKKAELIRSTVKLTSY